MSRDGSIVFDWADGEHRFRLAIGELRELQEKCDQGPEEIFRRLESGSWRVNDLLETIRLGLIGGGLRSDQARTLLQRYVVPGSLMTHIEPAMRILGAALAGVPDEAPKKSQEGESATMTPSPMESGASPPSTETVQ